MNLSIYELKFLYVQKALSYSTVKDWYNKINHGQFFFQDEFPEGRPKLIRVGSCINTPSQMFKTFTTFALDPSQTLRRRQESIGEVNVERINQGASKVVYNICAGDESLSLRNQSNESIYHYAYEPEKTSSNHESPKISKI